jgi:hypothetical protein
MDTLTASSANRHPLKIGIIGLGRSALTRHIPILKKMVDLFSVVAVCDITKERRTIVEKDLFKYFGSYCIGLGFVATVIGAVEVFIK